MARRRPIRTQLGPLLGALAVGEAFFIPTEGPDQLARSTHDALEVRLTPDDEKLYSKLYVSSSDIAFARYCASVILKRGWHGQPWERRGTIYQQQAAFTSALVTAYARPFTRSRGWPELPPDVITYSSQEAALHEYLMKLRHTVYAHSDSTSYSIRPWRSGDFSTAIVGAPVLRITLEETTLFQVMSSKLLASIDLRMQALLQS